MPDAGAFYIVATGGGKCLTSTPGAKPINDLICRWNKAQQWIIEYSDEENVVAFKNCEEGKYLHAMEPIAAKINWGTIGLKDEKQWWTLEKGKAPGSCLIRSNAYPPGKGSYLNDFEGRYMDNNYVHMWEYVDAAEWWLTWRLVDANNVNFNPKEYAAQGSEPTAINGGDSGAREAALAEKEEKLKDLEAREASLAEKEGKLKDLEQKEAALAQKEKDIEAREAGQSEAPKKSAAGPQDGQQARDLEKREAAVKKKEEDAATTASAQREQAEKLEAREEALRKREQQNASKAQDKGGDELEALRAKNENLKLQLKIKDLEDQLRHAQDSPNKPGGPTKANEEELAKLREENARLKKLVGQQSRPSTGTGQKQANGVPRGSSGPANGMGASKATHPGVTPSTAKSGLGSGTPAATSGGPRPKPTEKVSTGAPAAKTPSDIERLRTENARLRQELQGGPQQRSPGKAPGAAAATPQQNGAGTGRPASKHLHPHPSANSAGGDKGAVHFDCGHVAYPMPRKMDRKVVGILYESK